MPGSKKEFANALEEGARFEFLSAPIAVEGNAAGEVAQVRMQRMTLGEPDAGGRQQAAARARFGVCSARGRRVDRVRF